MHILSESESCSVLSDSASEHPTTNLRGSALPCGPDDGVVSLRRDSSLGRDPSERLHAGVGPGHLGRTGQPQSPEMMEQRPQEDRGWEAN